MLCFVSIEHERLLQDPVYRYPHLAYCLDVQLKLEGMTGQPCLVQRYERVTRQRLKEWGVQALLISGNAADWSAYDSGSLDEMLTIIREAEWPILGFCGGIQLIALAHGATVAPMRPLRPGEPDVTTLSAPGYLKEWGYKAVDVIQPDPLLDGLGPAPAMLEVHYCEVKDRPPGFDVLAATADCPIQILRRADRLVVGTQFHPEGFTDRPFDRRSSLVTLVYPDGPAQPQPAGRTLIANFFRLAGIPC